MKNGAFVIQWEKFKKVEEDKEKIKLKINSWCVWFITCYYYSGTLSSGSTVDTWH